MLQLPGAHGTRAGRNAKEIMIPKISVTGLRDYTHNVGYKTGSIDFSYETKTFNYDRGIKFLADVMDVGGRRLGLLRAGGLQRCSAWAAHGHRLLHPTSATKRVT